MTSRRLTQTLTDTTGQTMTEYGILLALMAAVVLLVLPAFGATTLKLFTDFLNAFGG
jgi:Flp pilus assembly pilin Flp